MKKYIRKSFVFLILALIIYANYNFLVELNFIEKYGSAQPNFNEEKIGTISIYSSFIDYPTYARPTGHSWLYIKNTSDVGFYLNDNFVPPDSGISVGTSAHPNLPHLGIWFNVEGYGTSYDDNISVTGDFYLEDLEYLEIYLENHDKWNILYNCSTFSSQVWNNVSAGKGNEFLAITPIGLYYQIFKDNNYEIGRKFSVFEYIKPYKK